MGARALSARALSLCRTLAVSLCRLRTTELLPLFHFAPYCSPASSSLCLASPLVRLQLLVLFRILSIFNLNLDILAPECLQASLTITYVQKWLFIEGMPLLIVFFLVVAHVFKLLYKLACTTKRKEKLNAHLPTLVSSTITVFRLLFFYLTRTSMDALTCIPTTPPQFRDISDPLNPKDPLLYMAGELLYRAYWLNFQSPASCRFTCADPLCSICPASQVSLLSRARNSSASFSVSLVFVQRAASARRCCCASLRSSRSPFTVSRFRLSRCGFCTATALR